MNLFKTFIIVLAASAAALAQTRPVDLSWTPSASGSAVLSQTLSVGTSTAGPFTLLATLATSADTYTDPGETIGATIVYQLTANAAPCQPNSTSTAPCGSASLTATVTIPPLP